MASIQLLDQITIDKIAAGEVIERPAAVVKELVENAIDAGSNAITVEIKEGGIAFIRITDNGSGIPRSELRTAFLRHSTSKIRTIDDLSLTHSLGFRGEALSSIASVAQVELLTKQPSDSVGSKYVIHGGVEQLAEDAAVNDGTTFLIRQLFYNVPARRKFLKTASTEASHVNELVMRLALSHPEISFQFINNGTVKLFTSGNGKPKDIIYALYGRDIANALLPISYHHSILSITGFIGKPLISRGNRNYETYFINGRYVKNNSISKAVEDAYKGYAMQHRYPFVALYIEMDTTKVDVNVHPTKMELRFSEQHQVYQHIYECVTAALKQRDMIPEVSLNAPAEEPEKKEIVAQVREENICSNSTESILSKPHKNTNRYGSSLTPQEEKENLDYFLTKMQERVQSFHSRTSAAEVESTSSVYRPQSATTQNKIREAVQYAKEQTESVQPCIKETKQLNLFEEAMLQPVQKHNYRLIGQVFQTYWLIEYKEQLYIIDQHAAHEKVLYEQTIQNWQKQSFCVQYLSPPIVLNLTMQEKQLLETHLDRFTKIGFELEAFGSDAYAIRGIPTNLESIAKKELFIEMLDELAAESTTGPADSITDKIASMSCKAAVKGNQHLTTQEMDQLVQDLLSLENPFHCPHGRPTIIAITKREMEKKFKRIL